MPKSTQAPVSTDRRLIDRLLVAFEQAARVDDTGQQYWLAREYGPVLGYGQWRNFAVVIEHAKAALAHEGGVVADHFADVRKMMLLGKGAQREGDDYQLSRRACYLIAVNGDPTKKEAIAAAQQYFVEQARKHELIEQASLDMERLTARRTLDQREQELKIEAASRGVDEHGFATVKHAGHKALFAKSPDKVKEQLGVPKDREIADFAQPVIVAGMGFATALTTHQTRAKDLNGTKQISDENAGNHKTVRKAMTDRAIFPEKLPPAGDIKAVEERVEKQRKKLVGRNVE